MNVHVNGEQREIPDGSAVSDAVRAFGPATQGTGVAVAVNGEVVPKATWADRKIDDGDRLEILVAIGGG